ncbi:MAG: DUF2961 domain-containing protein, partial [Armatimonadetes bacterium]|nr:DUF2961 domain-containing protein [Armatimonadota bacterium]
TIKVLLCLLTGIAPLQAGTVDTGSILREMYDLTSLPFFKDFCTRQFSSYDRTGGNKDWGTFLGNNGDAVILADIQGPGCISRYWTTKLGGVHGTLRVFLDGEEQPRVSVEQGAFFGGGCPPFARPLTDTSSAGWFSYFPIPFAKSCRIETIGGGDFYQVTYRTYPSDTDVKTFAQNLGAAQMELDKVLATWKDPARSINRQSGAKTYKVEIPAVSRAILTKLSGPACIDELTLEANSLDSIELQKTVLRIYWDDEKHPSVEVPLADSFGNGFGKLEYASLPLGLTKGIYYCRFPMPFARSALIEIENGMRYTQSLEFRLTVRKLETTSNMGYFHAKRNRRVNKSGIPYTILRASGRGHFVGCVLNLEGQKGLGFLEGDELFYVDGEKEPSIHGTGTEDYFNAGWYFMEGTFAMPLHGCTVCDEPNLRIQAYRFHLTDCVPFEKELRVYIEHGPTNSEPNTIYSSTAYWYQTEPHREFVLLPPASQLFYRGNVILPDDVIRFTPEMVMEGEYEVVQWNSLSDAWRGGNLLICNGEKPISAEITVPGEDRYEIVGY